MTEPLPVAPDPAQFAVEQAAAIATVSGMQAQMQGATQRIIAAYLVYAGAIDNPIPDNSRRAFLSTVSRILALVTADIREPLWEAVWRALQAGQQSSFVYLVSGLETLRSYGQAAWDQAFAGILYSAGVHGPVAAGTAQWAGNLVAATQARLEASLLSARAMPNTILAGGTPVTLPSVLAALAPAQKAVQDLERDVRWAINAAYNQAVRDSTEQANVGRMWIAEEDACLHCLALSGTIAPAGGSFDADATYYRDPSGTPKPLPVYPPGPLWGPPRHPNCRCSVRPVPVLQGYPVMPWETREYHPSEALQREAARSVLRGDSGSDSLRARLRATDALLAVGGGGLPVTVRRRAARAVRRGQYGG